MQNEIRMELRKVTGKPVPISLESQLFEEGRGEELKEAIPDPRRFETEVELRYSVGQNVNKLKLKDRDLIRVVCEEPGLTQKEYAARCGISQSHFSRRMKAIRDRLLIG